MRERRIMLGLTQQQMAELIGVTYQQAHKYEKGINRVAAGRLYSIAQALGVDVGYFFEGLQTQTASCRHLSSGCSWISPATTWTFRSQSIGRQSSRLPERSPRARTGTSAPREVLVADRSNGAADRRKRAVKRSCGLDPTPPAEPRCG
jgi:transcriptional regulator with XRE-family HTH domain